MAVAAHHDEVAPRVGRVRQDRARDVGVARYDPLDLDLQAVAGEMLADVGAGNLVALARSLATITTSTALARRRSGIASAIARAALRLASQHTITRSSLSPALWM